MLICVFRHSPKTPFSPLQKHRKYRCFDSILGLREKENIVNSVVLSLVGAKNIANYDVLGTFLNASFRTTGQKHRKIQCFCCFAILIFNFFSRLLQKHRKYHGFCCLWTPVLSGCLLLFRAARAPFESVFWGVFGARARTARNNNNKKQSNNNSNSNNNNNNSNNNNNNIINNNININIINNNNNINNIINNNNNNNINNIINNNNNQKPKPTKNQLLPPNTNSHSLPRHCRWVR